MSQIEVADPGRHAFAEGLGNRGCAAEGDRWPSVQQGLRLRARAEFLGCRSSHKGSYTKPTRTVMMVRALDETEVLMRRPRQSRSRAA